MYIINQLCICVMFPALNEIVCMTCSMDGSANQATVCTIRADLVTVVYADSSACVSLSFAATKIRQ
jgi:hypothetical protein